MSNSPPRPKFPPGHGGSIRTPHDNDVLSGRGGRINGHPGNVRFRDMVDSLKRDYLDPRTKKVEKARIAARIVSNIRALNPTGKFLKEDPHTGLWIEIGDERAWKKAGQALRESAPEIRAERQAHLQRMAGQASPAPGGTPGNTMNVMAGVDNVGAGTKFSSKGRKSRGGADPPGPRHRPNPPEREGLATNNVRSNTGRSSNGYGMQQNSMMNKNAFEEDEELNRMRQEYLQMQRLQQIQQRRMQEYANAMGGGGQNYTRDSVQDEYQQMLLKQQQMMMMQQQERGGNQPHSNNNNYQPQDIAAAIMDDDLLPLNAGFDIPALRDPQQKQQNSDQSNYQNNNDGVQAYEAFDRQFNACDKTVSTMSSFDVQSMDMCSLGGFSFSQSGYQSMANSNYNMSGLISTGSAVSHGDGAGGSSRKSALERKLEKVNEQHRREVARKQQLKQQQGPPIQHDLSHQQPNVSFNGMSMAVPKKPGRSSRKKKEAYNSSNMNMASLNSFGFEAIEEDDITEGASYKMSNLGLSEMDMTFGSDVLSIRSNSAAEKVDGEGSEKKSAANKKKKGKPKAPKGAVSSGFVQSAQFKMDDFNESFKSMEMKDGARAPLPDPDGEVAAGGHGRRKDSSSGRHKVFSGRNPTTDPSPVSKPPNHDKGKDLLGESEFSMTDLGMSDMTGLADFGASLASVQSQGSEWLNQFKDVAGPVE